MDKKNLLLRIYSPINARLMLVAVVTAFIMSVSMSVSAQNSGSLAGQQCPQSVVDSYTVVGPDGNVYPTWHPAVDPTYGCWFAEEHGSDPHLFVGFAAVGMPAFGYTSKQAGLSEPLEGFKVFITNNDLNGHAWMMVLHQGTRGPKRAFTQYHSLEWYITTLDGKLLVAIRTMVDFGYASPNCSGPGNETPAQFVAIPGSGSGYNFSGYQPQRRFVPTVECATTRVYENWQGIVNVANVFKAMPNFDIDNASTVINPNNPNEVRYMCEFRSPNENCASFYGTQWSGNKRGVLHPQQQVNNPGPEEFYTDAYGKAVAAGTPGAIKQFVTKQGWSQTLCNCTADVFRLPKNSGGLYVSPDPGAGNDSFKFGPGAPGSQPPASTPAPTKQPPASTPTPPIPTDPSVIVYANPANANPGDKVEVSIGVANLKGLYGLQTQCTVDPNVLTGTTHSDGTIFTSGTSFFVDNGFKAGNWVVAASLLQPHPAFSGAGIAYKLNYTVKGAGSTPITCTALAVDANGNQIHATVINGTFNGGVSQPPPTTQPTAVPTNVPPTAVPTNVPTSVPTAVPTNVPPTVVPSPSALSTISGVMQYQNHPDNAGITVQLVTPDKVLATVTTNADGHYTFTDVPVGSYGVTAIAPNHLRVGKVVNVSADGQTIDVGTIMLPAGDTDDSGTIDLLDASLIGANFDGAVPPSPDNADLNVDGHVDIRDLALIGSNFGLTGPVVIK